MGHLKMRIDMRDIIDSDRVRFKIERIHSAQIRLHCFINRDGEWQPYDYWVLGADNEILWGGSDKSLEKVLNR